MQQENVVGEVVSVSRSAVHGFSKDVASEIRIVAGLGIEGDAHSGATVQHLYRKRKNPAAPNLCQVHLLQESLFAELAAAGLSVGPGELGENIAVRGLDLLVLPVGTVLRLGSEAAVTVTGLREPCSQMNGLRPGLMKRCLGRTPDGKLIRKAGIMGVATEGGTLRAGDPVRVELPPQPWRTMGPV